MALFKRFRKKNLRFPVDARRLSQHLIINTRLSVLTWFPSLLVSARDA
jgi:hypothetical protein